jgi:hypothetical protein
MTFSVQSRRTRRDGYFSCEKQRGVLRGMRVCILNICI